MSDMTKIEIEEASDEQLRFFAEVHQQIPAADLRTRADIIAAIEVAGWRNSYIFATPDEVGQAEFDDQEEAVEFLADTVARQVKKYDDPTWLIRIESTDRPGGKDPVPVGCNGDIVVLQREMKIELPHRFAKVLANAKRETLRQNMETGEIIRTRWSNYPVTVLKAPSKAAVEAWERKQAAKELGADALGAMSTEAA